ncbi:similar to Saccharomyces cerevisiae YER114C BOI2 Protein implicated in polar growth, functionally redundant with Boi1p [Maudiozyma barnettii]|uniref:Similar to Saccharomyces cerevisiae YER114C BOI2 Protein implicated in polar growth, functionally redundant with Boi1p n=1 Tax=Maudiozyma barnettii TaxID=61262 RepID=A0A8H2ZFV5_9SACH|nr:Boi2p [Kazachstania barnettii]CAB4252155.1 similar to Saccharomyces cerevisiae YER114C BOI2 Protein implicated in polar growth, functionally redundant with Boi1p [Kazachstania barnettii]CAD1778727.1 similar to Saccharomyces cerevisiae YER114C BOI2 Protein implicated in polar growth, functionally redundant with Boi1p [Kazachstania barnettii]
MSKKLTSTLSEIDTTSAADISKDSQFSAVSGESPRIFPIYICINEYSKRMEDELDMKPGDKIQVITDDREYNDGWYFGLNLRTKEEGLYPVVFTQKISNERKPTLMRAKSLKRMNSMNGMSDSNTSLVPSAADSSADLSIPQVVEVAAPVSVNHEVPGERHVSVKSTMSDIDRALQDFQIDENSETDKINYKERDDDSPVHSIAGETIFSETTDLNVEEGPSRSQTTGTDRINNGVQASSSLDDINGKSELDVANAQNWTPEEVTEYFIQSGFDVQSSSRFKQHKISGKILFELELSHLKELDVSSFGTRFEMFKEIAALKDAMEMATSDSQKRKKELMPAAEMEHISVNGHARPASQSVEELPMRSTSSAVTPKQRPTSVLINGRQASDSNIETLDSNIINPASFASPRRAPKPPSYPSPAQPPKSPLVNRLASPINASESLAQSPYRTSRTSGSNEHISGTPNSRNSYSRNTKSGVFSPFVSESIKEEREDSNNNKRSSVIYSPPHETSSRNNESKESFELDDQEVSPDVGHEEENANGDSSFEEEDNHDAISDRPTSSIYATSSDHGSSDEEKIIKPKVADKEKKIKRNSSVLSYFALNKSGNAVDRSLSVNTGISKSNSLKLKNRTSFVTSPFRQQFTENAERNSPKSDKRTKATVTDADPSATPKVASKSKKDKRRSVSANGTYPNDTVRDILGTDQNKRSVSEAVKPKKLRALKSKPPLKKQSTSAFMEGIRNVSVDEAIKTADYSGWMSKKGSGKMSTWKNRFFTLHGTRLSYFSSTSDTRERGLIDITAHRVVPAKEDDKFVTLYAASTGKGRYCFKLIPPAPGSKKGLTFTQPRIHYFAVDTKEEMRGWMATLIKTTIDIDKTVPVISSYTTPTVSLKKAKMMLADAREETRKREEELSNNANDDEALWNEQQKKSGSSNKRDKHKKDGNEIDESTTVSETPNLSINTSSAITASTAVNSNGFASPYLLASGVLSPNLPHSPGFRKVGSKEKKGTEYFDSEDTTLTGAKF